ncbi:uncharacterized protein LOC101221687 isoform X1 [Cucumis sativus]|uniref:uncharacterized protein LOC101221687 isoform X1 n=1 Tax=Cucumis sativus TaxID=3659 RepID=UPI0005EC8CA3|nr:uncharacterized protein LOC101221687 isoform X1 [Cucumis sativus]XP_031744068.1 uncharacterized protein LOC101221687 isoform X1 [Cucumis sativus]KAE8647365.1 hypothetical protein Csa_004279 [Cucumis sativus]
MRQQGQYSDSGLGAYSVSQMHHVPSQMVEQSHPDPFEGRLEAFTPEREHSYVASKNEDQWRWERDESKMPNSMTSHMFNEGQGQGGDATRSYFQGQRPNPKLGLEKGSNNDPRSQSHGKNMESRFGDGPLPQNFDGLEQKFIDDIIKLTKEQNDAEDEENARHRERILAINAQYEEQLAALRVRHAGRRDELLRRESTARQHQYQKGIMDHYPNGGIGPGDPRGNSGVTNLAASGQAHQNYESEHFDSFRERARFLGNSARDPNLDPRGSYPGGRVYDTASRLGSNGNITWHVVVHFALPPDLDQVVSLFSFFLFP